MPNIDDATLNTLIRICQHIRETEFSYFYEDLLEEDLHPATRERLRSTPADIDTIVRIAEDEGCKHIYIDTINAGHTLEQLKNKKE